MSHWQNPLFGPPVFSVGPSGPSSSSSSSLPAHNESRLLNLSSHRTLLLPPATTHVIFVDIDNSGNIFSVPLSSENVPSTLAIYIFGGPELPKVPLESVQYISLMMQQNRFHIVHTRETAPNAADFALSLYAGMLHILLRPQVEFLVISKDSGLDNVVSQLNALGRPTKRIVAANIQVISAACKDSSATAPTEPPASIEVGGPRRSDLLASMDASSRRSSMERISRDGSSSSKPAESPSDAVTPSPPKQSQSPSAISAAGSADSSPRVPASFSSPNQAQWPIPHSPSHGRSSSASAVFSSSSSTGTLSPATTGSTWADIARGLSPQRDCVAAQLSAGNTSASSASESSDLDDAPSNLVGQPLPLDPKLALGLLTTRFYSRGYGGVQQLKQDLKVTLDKLEDPAEFALQMIVQMKLKPFNKKRGHFRVFPKLILRVLSTLPPERILESNRPLAKEVLQILENNTFGKKTINKLKMIFRLERYDMPVAPPPGLSLPLQQQYKSDAEASDSTLTTEDEDLKVPAHFRLTTGVNPLFSAGPS